MTTRDTAPVGAPCWIDLFTTDPDKSRAFYGELFGWKSEAAGEEFGGYMTFTKDDVPVAGGMTNDGSAGMPDMWNIHLAVTNAQATLDAATAAGGVVHLEPMVVRDLGTMSMIGDPGGAAVGAWQPDTFQGFGVYGEPGTAGWFELHTRDYDAVLPFYRDVFGWDITSLSDTPEFRYSTYSADGEEQLAGIMDSSGFLPEGVPSHWAVYISVEDADAAVAKALELGAAVVQPAEDTPYGRLAGLTDPTGANFKLLQPPAA